MAPYGDDLDHLLSTAQGWLHEGHRVAIATVIETWGSAPRRRGAHAIIRDDGQFVGSVSGGCVEGDVIVAARGLLVSGGCRRLDYGVADQAAWAVGLACGGRISVFVQSIDTDHFSPGLIDRIRGARAAGATVSVATDLATGCSGEGDGGLELFVTRYAPPLRLMIVGAVHIARSMVPMARMLGYAPQLVDPRGSFAVAFGDVGIIVDERWPDEALADWRPDAASAVVTLTHDPKIDDPALAAALRSPAYYIAALGSRRTHAARLERLAAQGFDAAALARICGPAGLAIGAANPPEIALSILAQATERLRAGV
ncbi:XdhC family protein [Sphingomonas sp. KC8]|uniref:XdhC family protein n=1 Tax=Sphingomonas sp. KC8 TaxID=1030157 RepID=UPI0002488A6C|nr:XdhC family protein [Sphingomonas sp. KC8]ARS25838.1 xanthine dehydrogenase accessory factor [Sphingomonas sp. KC8]